MNFSREQIEAASTPEELAALFAGSPSPTPPSNQHTVDTLAEVAQIMGVSYSTTKGWRMESPPMPGTDGAWPIPAIIQWRIARLTNSDLATTRKQQEIELNAIAIEQKRLDLDREKGELLARADVELWAATACVEAREMVMQLPEILSASMPPNNRDFVRDESDRHCRAALTALRRRLEKSELDELTSGSVPDGDETDEPQQGTDR